jgi:hypothetical protein
MHLLGLEQRYDALAGCDERRGRRSVLGVGGGIRGLGRRIAAVKERAKSVARRVIRSRRDLRGFGLQTTRRRLWRLATDGFGGERLLDCLSQLIGPRKLGAGDDRVPVCWLADANDRRRNAGPVE